MGLVKCAECKKKISSSALTCPNCGVTCDQVKNLELQKRESKGCLGFVFVVLIIIVILSLFGEDTPSTSVSSPRQQEIERQFSAWDGSHYGLVNHVKATMHDPSSFEHVETRFTDKQDHLVIIMTFRGKNAFGGTIMSKVVAKVDLQGNVLEAGKID